MTSFKIIACIVTFVTSSWARIPYDAVQINIFDQRARDFETRVIDTLNSTKHFYANQTDSPFIDILPEYTLEKYSAYIKQIKKTAQSLRDTLAEQSEWRLLFTKAIAHEVQHGVAESERNRLKGTMQTVQSKIKLLDESNPDLDNRRTIASILHTQLDKMINFFDQKTALLRKYPLMGAAPLIQLSLLVAVFSPFARMLIPFEAKNPQLSCKMHDVLLDYRPRVVHARLHQLNSETSIFDSIMNVMAMPFNQYGYNKTNPAVIHCERGCESNGTFSNTRICLNDTFSSAKFLIENNEKICILEYAAMIRHRVEELFPNELLNNECVDRAPANATGFGWLTITLQNIFTYGKADGSTCKLFGFHGCDPYVKLFVDENEVLKTARAKHKFVYDTDVTFTSDKIAKNSTIKIEIWDASSAFWEHDALILTTQGDVNSFLKQPLREGVIVKDKQNAIETVSFWQDEYK